MKEEICKLENIKEQAHEKNPGWFKVGFTSSIQIRLEVNDEDETTGRLVIVIL